MKNTLETKSETSDRNDGCPQISHMFGVGVKGRSPVLRGGLMLSPRMLLQQHWGPSAATAAAAVQNLCEAAAPAWNSRKTEGIKAGRGGGERGIVPCLVLTCRTGFP